jgi:hypothetical protein
MNFVRLGVERHTRRPVEIPVPAFRTHFHLIGGTGKGKTTAIHTMLQQLLLDPFSDPCVVVIDRLGGLSSELLLWLASDYCTDAVRERLVYIEPAREDVVIGFNPLLFGTPGEGYYKVQRATEIILRAWESVNIEAMPRLARWTFNAFWAAAQLGLTIADCAHLLLPGSPYFAPLLGCLPPRLRDEWSELINARSAEVTRTLESTRNRLKPYFESDILRRMFGSTRSALDVRRFMREGKLVLLNLAPQNRLSTQLGDAIGALVLNEVLAVARSLPRIGRCPTYLLLDEFQNFVGPDIESALPEVRQLGLRLILSHQSLAQLKRGDHDLTSMIFQAQSRMVFGVQGEDADLLAHELASITFDPKRIKDEHYVRRQRIAGHRIIELSSWSQSEGDAENWGKQYGKGWTRHENVTHGIARDVKADGTGRSDTEANSSGGARHRSSGTGRGEHLMPEYEEYEELASRTFYSFDEWRHIWAKGLRTLKTGSCLLRLVDDPELHEVEVERRVPGYLDWDDETLAYEMPEVLDDVEQLKERNFRSDLFSAPADVDREMHERIESVIHPAIVIQSHDAQPSLSALPSAAPPVQPHPFA